MIRLTLPFPPGVNNLFATRGNRRIVSQKYEAWRREAHYLARAQVRAGTCIKGPFNIVLTFGRKDRRRRDLDGLAKAPLDLLVTLGIIEDDSLADEIILRWASPRSDPVYDKAAMVEVEISGP